MSKRKSSLKQKLLPFGGFLFAVLLRLYMKTLQIKEVGVHPLDTVKAYGSTAIYCFWHYNLLIPAYLYHNTGAHVLISRHRDGEYIAQIIERLGFDTIRGSTTRGGMKALKELRRIAQKGDIVVFTPDGPRGPRGVLQQGTVYLASRTGLPIIPVGVSSADFWELPSWDRFRVPKPFQRALVQFGEPIYVPKDMDQEGLEEHRQKVEDILNNLSNNTDQQCAANWRSLSPLNYL